MPFETNLLIILVLGTYLIKGTFMKFRHINNTNITTTSDITVLNSSCVKI